MTMGDSEIKNLFVRANAQVHIDEARKEKNSSGNDDGDGETGNQQAENGDDDVHQKYSASAISVYG